MGGAVAGGNPGVVRICPRLRGFPPPPSPEKRTWIVVVYHSCMESLVWASKLKTIWDPAEVKECDIGVSLASTADFLAESRAGAQARARKGLLGLEAPLKLDKHPAHTQTTKGLHNLKDFTKLVASLFPQRSSLCSQKGGLRQVSKRREGRLGDCRL